MKNNMLVIALALVAALFAGVPGFAQEYPTAETGGIFREGLKLFYEGNFDQGQAKFEEVYAKCPLDTLNLSFLGDCYARRRDIVSFIAKMEKEIMAKGEDAQGLAHLGFLYYVKSRSMPGLSVDDALRELDSALRIDPDIALAYTVKGLIYFDKRLMPRAKSYLMKALELNPRDIIAAEYLANIFMVDEKKYEDALMIYRKVAEICPDYADAWFFIGSCNEYLGKADDAISAFQKNLELDPKGVIQGYWSPVRIGDILMGRKMYQEALTYYEKSLAIRPQSTYSQYKIEQCRKLLKEK